MAGSGRPLSEQIYQRRYLTSLQKTSSKANWRFQPLGSYQCFMKRIGTWAPFASTLYAVSNRKVPALHNLGAIISLDQLSKFSLVS